MVQIHSPRPIPINPLTYRRQKTKRAPGKPPSAKRVSGCSKGSRIRQLKREGRVLIVKTCLTTPDLVFCKSRAGLPTRLLVGTGVIFREFATNRSTELVFHEPALEVRFVRGAEGPTSFLTTQGMSAEATRFVRVILQSQPSLVAENSKLSSVISLPCPLTLAETWLEARVGIEPGHGPFLVCLLYAVEHPDLPEWFVVGGAVFVCVGILCVYLRRWLHRTADGQW